MEIFELSGSEYIELNKLLKMLTWVQSGGMAKVVILNGEVLVNGEILKVIRKKLIAGTIVEFNDQKVQIK